MRQNPLPRRGRAGRSLLSLLMFVFGLGLALAAGALAFAFMAGFRPGPLKTGPAVATARPAKVRPPHNSIALNAPKEPESSQPALPPALPEDAAMNPSAQTSDPRLAEAYQLSADVAFEHLPAQLIVLPNRNPVELRAAVTAQDLPAGCRERSRHIEWTSDAGEITRPTRSEPGGDAAVLHLPEGSRSITLHATLDVQIETGGGETSVHKEAVLELLSPAPGSMLVNGFIDGFEIGHYLDPQDPHSWKGLKVRSQWPYKHGDRYRVPDFFYKVTPEIKGCRIAPHQTLGMWMIDFPWKSLGKTQYIALDLNLVRKIEDLQALMTQSGFHIKHFVPIYGFRPPAFNLGTIESQHATTLKEPFSMHQYGRAIDLIIDEDGDGVLDDLNHDGVIDIRDAEVIEKFVNQLDRKYREEGRMEMVGGAGVYDHNDFVERPMQSPYIHIDTRGFLEEDGTLVRWRSVGKGALAPAGAAAHSAGIKKAPAHKRKAPLAKPRPAARPKVNLE